MKDDKENWYEGVIGRNLGDIKRRGWYHSISFKSKYISKIK